MITIVDLIETEMKRGCDKITQGRICPVCAAEKFSKREFCCACQRYKEKIEEKERLQKRIDKWGKL